MAEKLLKLEVVAPDHQALSVEAKSVVVRTQRVRSASCRTTPPLIAALKPEIVRYEDAAGKKRLHLHRRWLRGSQ